LSPLAILSELFLSSCAGHRVENPFPGGTPFLPSRRRATSSAGRYSSALTFLLAANVFPLRKPGRAHPARPFSWAALAGVVLGFCREPRHHLVPAMEAPRADARRGRKSRARRTAQTFTGAARRYRVRGMCPRTSRQLVPVEWQRSLRLNMYAFLPIRLHLSKSGSGLEIWSK
jgi:hypothetical protein